MNLTENEVKAWWDEVERLVGEMVKPCVPMPPPPPPPPVYNPRWQYGSRFYTLKDDMQFAVDSTYPNAVGWKYE